MPRQPNESKRSYSVDEKQFLTLLDISTDEKVLSVEVSHVSNDKYSIIVHTVAGITNVKREIIKCGGYSL